MERTGPISQVGPEFHAVFNSICPRQTFSLAV